MTKEVGYFCPKCQSMDLAITVPTLIDPSRPNGGSTFACKLCGTTGDTGDLIGAITEEGDIFWNTERIGMVLLNVGAKHAAAPLIQVLEFLGLTPRVDPITDPAQQEDALKVREAVFRDVMSAFVSTCFESAARHALPYHEKYSSEQDKEILGRVFSYAAPTEPPPPAEEAP